MSLDSQKRLHKAWEFTFVFEKGKFVKGTRLNLWIYLDREKKLGAGGPKIGVVVSRKAQSKATKRNLWKRRIREVFRQQQQNIDADAAVIVQAKNQKNVTSVPDYQEIAEEMIHLIKRAQA